MYQVLAYYKSINAGTYSDMPAVPDPNFSARGGTGGADHWIFTEPYDLCAAAGFATTLTAMQLFDATFNAINIPQVYPVTKGVVPPSNPNIMDFRMMPIPLPLNEEVALQASAGAGGAEDVFGLIWIKPSGIGAPSDRGVMASERNPRVTAIVTASITLTKGVWSPFANLTFTNPLKGGAYQVNGLYLVCAASLAFKLNFVKAPLYQGRKLFPGSYVENAYGNVPLRFGSNWLGPLGRFNNFELPQISVLGNAAVGAATYTGYLDLTYLGNTNADAMP